MNICAVILAAGLGTRMKSETPKLLHDLLGKSIIEHTVQSIQSINPAKTIVVLNRATDTIRQRLTVYEGLLSFAIQDNPLGTADALKSAISEIPANTDAILVLNGDSPLITSTTLQKFIQAFHDRLCNLALLSFRASNPAEYGRIIREDGKIKAIVEHKDATVEQRAITEVNSGVYLMDKKAMSLLEKVKKNPLKGEYYLTDLVALSVSEGLGVEAFDMASESELIGINSREDLSRAVSSLRWRINRHWMEAGVTILDPSTVIIEPGAEIGIDTIIYPNVIIQGKTVLGCRCVIYPNTRIINSFIADEATIKDSTVIEDSEVRHGVTIGPFAHLRPKSVIGENSKIGNFVEVKKSQIGKGVKASHLSYIGDAEVGDGTNIGAGTITCNYDGVNKHKTVIGKGVFVGSDTQLVAPVSVGDGSYIGAGSTITKDVPPDSLGISRTNQRNIKDWAKRKKALRRDVG